MSNFCRRCGKELTSDKSKTLGIGPECLKQHMREMGTRRLFTMGKANRIKTTKKHTKQTFKKEHKAFIAESISEHIEGVVENYTLAMLFACKDHLKFGPKRAQAFAWKVQEIFDDVNSERISLEDIRQVVKEELGIDLKQK